MPLKNGHCRYCRSICSVSEKSCSSCGRLNPVAQKVPRWVLFPPLICYAIFLGFQGDYYYIIFLLVIAVLIFFSPQIRSNYNRPLGPH
jgi:hypothetical protein